jgi:hypothetical protein
MFSGLERQANASEQQATALAGAAGSLAFASERRLAWFALVCLSAMFILSMAWRPADEQAFILCPFRALTGLLCPGCGMTRAFCALGHGELRRAIHFNALSPLLYLSLIVVWIGAAATVLNLPKVRAALMRLRPNPSVSVAILALVLVWWVARLVWGI